MDVEKNTRIQAILIILLFVLIGGGLVYWYNSAHTPPDEPTPMPIAYSSASASCEKDRNTSTPPAIPAFTWNHTGLITLWFDDAWKSQYTNAFPLMKKYGFTGAISIPTRLVCYQAFMTWDEIRTVQAAGWETTAHSRVHKCELDYYNDETTKEELVGSKEDMIEHGLRTDNFVMPCGYGRADIVASFADGHPPIIETAKQHFASYRTTKGERLNALPLLDPYNLKAFIIRNTTTVDEIQAQIKMALDQKAWLILVFHQIDDSNQAFSIPSDRLQKILEVVKNSGIQPVLPSQVLTIH